MLPSEAKRELLAALEEKSTREVDRELMGRATEPLALKKDRVRAVSDTWSELKCLVKDETLKDFETLRGLLAHKHPSLKMGELLEIVAKIALQALDPGKAPKRKLKPREASPQREAKPTLVPEQRAAKPALVSRYIKAQVKRKVWRNAQGRCQACGSHHRLQIDHIQAHVHGGSNPLENLRLLCFHCNQREADQKLGRGKMEAHRKQPLTAHKPHPYSEAEAQAAALPQPKQIHLPIPPLQGLAGGTAAQAPARRSLFPRGRERDASEPDRANHGWAAGRGRTTDSQNHTNTRKKGAPEEPPVSNPSAP